MFLFKSLRSSSNRNDAEKASVQRRMFLAENTPEPVFDLSGCNLPEVPAGVFSKCRVFRKTHLLLQNNRITLLPSLHDLVLLSVLDVSSNLLEELPESIGWLVNLQVLDVHRNQLSVLPKSLSKLKALRTVDISENERLLTIPNCLKDVNVKMDGCPLLGLLSFVNKSDESDNPPGETEQNSIPPTETADTVWNRKEKNLQTVRQQMAELEERLRSLTMLEYAKRDERQQSQMIAIAEERVELAANLNDLMNLKDAQLCEFRAAAKHFDFPESDVTDGECTVCLEACRLVVLMPCGHTSTCRDCSEKLTHCPLCRNEVRLPR